MDTAVVFFSYTGRHGLLYGGGLRVLEALRLRVKDVEFTRNEIIVREGKGFKDRVTMLPRAVADGLFFGPCMCKTLPPVMAMCTCRTRLTASTRTPGVNGAGNMCFRRQTARLIHALA